MRSSPTSRTRQCASLRTALSHCDAAVDPCQCLFLAQENQGIKDRWTDGGAADGNADRLSHLADSKPGCLTILFHNFFQESGRPVKSTCKQRRNGLQRRQTLSFVF